MLMDCGQGLTTNLAHGEKKKTSTASVGFELRQKHTPFASVQNRDKKPISFCFTYICLGCGTTAYKQKQLLSFPFTVLVHV